MKVRWILVILITCTLNAQEAKAPAPRLKDSVALNLRTMQVQFLSMQQQLNQIQNQYAAALSTALKESDLDPEKYELDPNTLVVREKPVAKSDKK